ncbi:MAG: hypothetical protein UHN88_02300 [Eubacterium sp.]|nr:hypothetical protein [Eubacterium sp.]
MEYRTLPHGGEKISVIGMGTSVVGENSAENVAETVTYALDQGINYIDLAQLGDVLAAEHYRTLEMNASDCLQCGHCNSRCPFSADQMSRMKEIEEYFGTYFG